MTTFLNFSRKNLLGVLLTLFLLLSLAAISFSVSNVREPVSRAASYSNGPSNIAGFEYGGRTSYPPELEGYCRPGTLPLGSNLLIGQWAIHTHYDERAYVKFDTRSIPSNATVTSAALQFTLVANEAWAHSGSVYTYRSFTLQARDFAWNDAISCSDWGGTSPTAPVVGSYPTASLPTSGGSNFPLNLSLSAIKKGGFTSFMLVSDRDAGQVNPGEYSKEEITIKAPELIVAFSTPSPPNPPVNPGGGGSQSGGSNTGGSNSGGSNRGSTSNKNLPNTLKKLNLKVSVPFLLGEMKVNLGVEQFSADLVLKEGQTDYSIDTANFGLPLNKIYTLTFSGDKILKKKIQFNASSSETAVNAMELTLGDLNADSAINNQDQLILLASISKQTSIGDINSDGATNSLDWSILLYNLGKVGD